MTRVEGVVASAWRIPTARPEADGTLAWNATTIVVVEARAGGRTGIGYTYTDAAAAQFAQVTLAPAVAGRDAMATEAAWNAMLRTVRNAGRPGLAACAISAVDCALWDLRCRLLGAPLLSVLGEARERVAAYASGGFTNLTMRELEASVERWSAQGFRRMKIKVGSRPAEDARRVAVARRRAGADVELFVDANGAYDRKQALELARSFAAEGVSWFEEPVSSDDLEGLRLLRDRAPPGLEIAAGEYGYDPWYFLRMLEAGAVDVLQADATRCLGVTGFLRAAALAEAHHVPLSSHCAPALHAQLCCAVPAVRHLECFDDHVRLEGLLFEGAPAAVAGSIEPDRTRPGFGLEFRRAEADRRAA